MCAVIQSYSSLATCNFPIKNNHDTVEGILGTPWIPLEKTLIDVDDSVQLNVISSFLLAFPYSGIGKPFSVFDFSTR
jgi:hypothetical protein